MKRLRDEQGQVIVMTVLCMAVLLGFVAFAVDMGIMLLEKRELQTAVDSAAIAGAAEIQYGDVTLAAQTDATQNGVNYQNSGTTLTVNSVDTTGGPTSGPHACPSASCSSYVEVIANQSTKTFFMNVFEELANHTGLGSMTVTARAVAADLPSPYCVYTLSPTPVDGIEGVNLSNGASIYAPTCGILDDASGGQALFVQGGSVTAKTIGVVGSAGGGGGTFTPTPTTGINPVGDPLSFLTPPVYSPASCAFVGVVNLSAGQQFGPPQGQSSACANGLNITGNGPVLLNPGTYIINGPMTITGSPTITGNGVTFYFPNCVTCSFSDTGTATLNLSAPTTGDYSGILFYQDPGNTQVMTYTGNNGTMSGIFYLPAGQLNFSGPGQSLNISVVAGSISATGNVVYSLTPYLSPSGTSPLSVPTLTE